MVGLRGYKSNAKQRFQAEKGEMGVGNGVSLPCVLPWLEAGAVW